MDGKSQSIDERNGRGDERVGLVLGGGAALGLAHVGVIRALGQEKIRVDVVVGCRMGAIVGGLWVTGRNADDFQKIAGEFSSKVGALKIFDPPIGRGLILLAISGLLWLFGYTALAAVGVVLLALLGLVPVSAVVNGKVIERWLKSKFAQATFQGTKIPFKVIGHDLLRREDVLLDQGLLSEAVFKSIALPGIIPPVMASGQMIVDGGVLNPLPVNVLRQMGIRKIIAVNVLPSPEDVCRGEKQAAERREQLSRISLFRHPWKVLAFRLEMLAGRALSPNIADVVVRSSQSAQYVFAKESGRQADVLIAPDLGGFQWFELYEAEALIQCGYDAAMRQIVELRHMNESKIS
ncbi:MAG: patatin-like phospholipase family protein [Candidatus Omnitrophica bacterium]|nr:patatin-like phospholipase family protein [Candidatus Omnitrophota bacterium]